MKINQETKEKYFKDDPEALFFLDHFDEPEGSSILEVGAHDCPILKVLDEHGFNMTGVDLRPYDYDDAKHVHIVGDFLNLPGGLNISPASFDCIYSVSSLEHFGLATYDDRAYDEYADIKAVHLIKWLLKPGGSCYITVPLGGKYIVVGKDWKVYDWDSIMSRLAQMPIELIALCVCEAYSYSSCPDGFPAKKIGDMPRLFDVLLNRDGFPGISVLLKMRKDK